jgi:hypothetical protein
MGRATKFILIALLTFTLFAGAQTASSPQPDHETRAATSQSTATAAQPSRPPKNAAKIGNRKRELNIAGFKFQRPDPATLNQDESNLPPASSPLPLISVIGFGVLVGGIISAMKTRS